MECFHYNYAVTNDATLKVIKMLYKGDHEAVKVKDNDENLPLHISVQSNSALDVIKMM